MKKINILYIDDERTNLNVFKATFRNDYNIFLAGSAKEGLETIEQHEIHIIIADQKMPEITGVDFFEMILKKNPEPIRILLTAFADIEAVIDAINKGQVYRYIRKPWDAQEIKTAIDNAYEVYSMRKELKERNEQLQKANDELNRFVYSASHDLKAPLVTILGIIKMAEYERERKDTFEYFFMIEECIKKLEEFIKNIINYYKNNRLDKDIREIRFKDLIHDVVTHYQYLQDITKIKINTEINQEGDFYSDEFRIRIILNNLLSNSIKYQKETEENKEVNISLTTEDNNAVLRVKDNGIGIMEEYQHQIFNMFFRATSQNSGSGIGLYIVKEAVQKINGEILFNSTEGKGSEFIVKIPNQKEQHLLREQEAISQS